MQIALQTKEGKQLDTENVKYMVLDNIEYALFPVKNVSLSETPVELKEKDVTTPFSFNDAEEEKVNQNLESFFGIKHKRVHNRSVAQKVRQWLNTAKPGESTFIKSPSDYAIRVACELQNVKAKIYKVKHGYYSITYDRYKTYARARTA